MSEADPNAWYLCACAACGKELKVRGQAPAKPLCLHCDVIRAAPEAMREQIRRTLAPVPEIETASPAVAPGGG